LSPSRPSAHDKPSVATREKLQRARRFQVVLLNDDYTTMEFVVVVLESIFRHSPAEAVQIMLKVHKEGRGVAGVYSHEVAESKVLTVHERAREAGFPLRATLEEA
jgi:ATP-dependent Clp protease adaptor protein ClpS